MTGAGLGSLGAGWKKMSPTGKGLVVVGALGGAYYIYKKRQASTASTALAGQPCTDANGNASVTDASGACILVSTGATGADDVGSVTQPLGGVQDSQLQGEINSLNYRETQTGKANTSENKKIAALEARKA